MLGGVATRRGGGGALDLLAPGTPVVVDPVMVAESGARLLDARTRRRRWSQLVVAARDRGHAQRPRGPRPRRRRTPRDGRGARARGPRARAARRSWSPAATATRRSTSSSTASASSRSPGERYPDGAAHGSGCTHSSTLAARLALGDDLESAARERQARRLRGGPRRPARDRRGAGPGRRLGCRALRGLARGQGAARPCAIIARRHEVPAHEARPRRGPARRGRRRGAPRTRSGSSRSSAASSTRACGPRCPSAAPAGRREAQHGQGLRRDPARRRARHLLPARRRRRAAGAARRCCSPLSATVIVIVALLWELVLPSLERDASSAHGARRRRSSPARATTPAASAAPSSARAQLLRSCVNDEEWAMYRDLGFIRVWGAMARAPRRAHGDDPRRRAVRLPRSTRTSRSSPTCRRPASCSTSTASSSRTRRARTAAPGCPTPTTCSPSGWR